MKTNIVIIILIVIIAAVLIYTKYLESGTPEDSKEDKEKDKK